MPSDTHKHLHRIADTISKTTNKSMPDLIDQCPLPELAEALKPYIKPREEVADIRRGIDSLLAEHIQDDDIPLSRATLSVIETSTRQNTPFTGVRRAFIRALSARQKAQAQYDALKTELGLLQQKPSEKDSHGNTVENPIANTVALIRQRQRRDKLLIIENALDNLEKARQSSQYADSGELLNNMQSQPPPPLAQQSQDDALTEAQSHAFELQRAVLRAQSSLQLKSRTISAQESSSDKLGQEQGRTEDWKRAIALRRARDDLIAWIEGELAKLSEDEEADPDTIMPKQPETDSLDEIRITLQDIYDRYIASRESLVRVLNTKYQTEPDTGEPSLERQHSEKNDNQTTSVGLASRVLPFIETLRSTAQDEAALMQHTSYLRRQLTAVSAETDQLLSRLSDESHMVRPGTSNTSAWTEAAREARAVDTEAIHSNLVIGETSIRGATEILTLAHLAG